FVHAHQVNSNATALLARASRAQEQGELELAADYLNRYLGFAPTDADALARYGLLLSDPKFAKTPRDTYQAKAVLEKALYRDPDRHDLRRCVVRLAMDLRLYSDAIDDIQKRLRPEFPED